MLCVELPVLEALEVAVVAVMLADVVRELDTVLVNVLVTVFVSVDEPVDESVDVRVVDGDVTSQLRKKSPLVCKSMSVFSAVSRACAVSSIVSKFRSTPRYSCGKRELPIVQARLNLRPV